MFRAATLAACILTSAAAAQTVDPAKPTSVAIALETLGYAATLDTDSVGDPRIKFTVNGINTTVFFYGCTDGQACKEIQFVASLALDKPVDVGVMNEWNDGKIAGNASLDPEGNVNFRFLLVMDGGVSQQVMDRALLRWEQALEDFTKLIGW